MIDFNWNYLYVNDAWMAFQKTRKEDFVGYPLMQKYPGIEQTDVFMALERCMKTRWPQQLKSEFSFSGQSKRWFEFRIKPVSNGIIVLSLDISEEREKRDVELILAKKTASELVLSHRELLQQNEEKEKRSRELTVANEALRKTNTELDRFVYSVSHDLRSPLTSILGLLNFIEKDSKEPDILLSAGMIRKSVLRLDDFINNILNYARNSRTPMKVEELPVKKIVEDVIASLDHMECAQGMRFEVKIQDIKGFYSDVQRFDSIIENLVSNAIKYRDLKKKNSFMKISAHEEGGKLVIIIEDNGIGIEDEFKDKVFDMFFRIRGSVPGSGLGLYIVREMVELLKGTITLTSNAGLGTSFRLVLKNLRES